MDKLIARSALSPQFIDANLFPVDFGDLQIAELPLAGIVRIQGFAGDAGFRAAVTQALGVAVPEPEASTSQGDIRLVWGGPHEFLCFCPLAEEAQYRSRFTAVAGCFVTATVISDSRVGFRMTGREAASFIAKGCAIDMHSEQFKVGHSTSTRFASLPALVMRHDEDVYVVYFDVGYIEFILKWIVDAAAEFASQRGEAIHRQCRSEA